MRYRSAAVALVLLAACTPSHPAAVRRGADEAPPGVLRIGIERPQSLDPAQARTPGELLVADQLFDGLTSYDPETLAVQPALAASWQSSPDQKKWDFTIRPGAAFSNGRAVTPADVKFTLERIAKKGSSSPAAAQLEPVSGFRAVNVDGKTDALAGVTVTKADVVHIELDQPMSSLPAVLGHPTFGIVPKEAVTAESPNFATDPVGSGPFMLQSRRDDLLHLVPAPAPVTPAVRAVDVYLEQDAAAGYSAFLAGQLDWTAVPPDRVEEVAQQRGPGASKPYLGELFYGFNLKNPKFADVRFRQAIVAALDRDAILRVVYGPSATVLNGLVPQGVPGAQPDACGDRCAHNPDRARALLADAFPAGKPVPEIQLDFDDDGTQRAVAQAMQANLRDVGITANLRPHTYADYLRFAVSGQQELFRLGWIGAYPTADAFLTPLFKSATRDNITGFSSPPVDATLNNGRAEPDEAKRLGAYQAAEKLVLDQMPIIPMAQFQFESVASARVSGLVVTGMGTFDATKVRVGSGH
ncbi:MAG TPA: ABC transporter substrate-binding protein [Acidimicrobiales bacterium]|jgi:oligopeptide transport system substrate-binding protein|nr:ABC transporter substrate-binding protein [Acidimicrobiales bacterium]